MDGPNYKSCSYQALSAQQTEETCYTYSWSPDFKNINTNTQTLSQSLSSLYGSLPEGEVHKVSELFFPSSSVEGIIIETRQNSSGVFGPNYYAYCGSPSSTGGDGSSSDAVLGGAIGGSLGGVAVLACATVAGAGIAAKYYLDKTRKRIFEDYDDVEMGEQPPTEPVVASDAFTAKGEGLEAGRIIIRGAMYGREYVLLNKIDRDSREVKQLKSAGLNIEFKGNEDEKEVLLGSGAFGRVFPARRRDNGQIDAMKIVVGTTNVQSSLREGQLQSLLGEAEGVLPLYEYLHFKPTPDNKREMKELLRATFGSDIIKEVNMAEQDVLVQVTPLAALGNGEDFQKTLAKLSDKKLKDELLTYFALSLLTGLNNMHDKGISHLDVKPSNILVGKKGAIYVSDFGCSILKDNLRGGIGDFRYFSPDRLAYCRSIVYGKGLALEAEEIAMQYSGKAADSFAAGVTLLEIALNEYPFDPKDTIKDMISTRDSFYFKTHLKEKYEDAKNWSILPVIKKLLKSHPKARSTTRQAQEELQKLKLKRVPEELFYEFRGALAKEKTDSKPKEVRDTNRSDSDSDFDSETSFTSSDYGKAYGRELSSLYKNLQEEYKQNEDAGDPADHIYSVPDLEDRGSDAELNSDFELPRKSNSDRKGKGKDKKYNYSSTSRAGYVNPEQISERSARNKNASADPYSNGAEFLSKDKRINNPMTYGAYTEGREFLN